MELAAREMRGMLRSLSQLLRSIDPLGTHHHNLAELNRRRRSDQPGTDHRSLGQWSLLHHNAQLDNPHHIAHQTSRRHRNAQQDMGHCKRHCLMHQGRTGQPGIGYRLRPNHPEKIGLLDTKSKIMNCCVTVCQVDSQVMQQGGLPQASV